MKKNVASQVIGAQMVSAKDGSAFTGSVTCYVTGDGGTQAAGSVGSGACAHEGNGFHSYSPAQAETNYDHIAFTFTGTGAVPVTIQVYTSFPQTGDGYGRLGAPAGASIAADIAALPTDADVNAACDSALADYDAPTKAEMDSAFATTNGYLDTEVAAILAAVDTEVAAIKAKTDNLPASPAATGDIPAAATIAAAVRDVNNASPAASSLGAAVNAASAPTAAAVADAVWDEAISGHLTAGSTGAALNAAGSAGDPWSTPLPGAYGAGTAGKIIGDNLNAPVATVDTVVDAIKAKTDNLPASPAATGAAMTLTAAYDAAKSAASQASVDAVSGYIDTEVAAILAAVDTEVAALVSELAKVPKSDGTLTLNATAVAAIKAALEAAGSHLTLVKAKTDGLNFTGTDVKATLDGEEVTPTAASKTGYSLVAAYDAAKTSAQAGDAMAVGVGGIQSTSFAAGAIDAAATAADAGTEIANAVKALVIESQGNYTLQQALSIILAVLAGQTADNGATLKTANGAATRVTATIDENNNRTAMTLAPSA